MTYMDFVALYALDTKRKPEHLLAETPLSFAIATNDRGDALVDALQEAVTLNLSGKRVLDVGCGYGGLCVALAKRNARPVGIDNSAKLVAYAEANAFGQSDISFSVMDFATKAVCTSFAAESFDLIFVNDMFDRHHDTDLIASNLDYLLAKGGSVYFKLANIDSLRAILAGGKTKTFGMPLLEPDEWHLLEAAKSPIHYKPLSAILGQLQYYNMPTRVLFDDEKVFSSFSERRLTRRVREIFSRARTPEYANATFSPSLRKQSTRLRDKYTYDLQQYGEDYAKFKYGSTFFAGLIGRPDASITPKVATVSLPHFGDVIRAEGEEVASTAAA
jgi:2-polyprenyl-3-methyl-5-hydroxy-6-metoxy-1,4-benzoquinol methylase